MNYINNEPVNRNIGDTCARVPLPETAVVDLTHSNTAAIKALHSMVKDLRITLYGDKNETNSTCQSAAPNCLRSEILAQNNELMEIIDELTDICTKLGMGVK